MFLQNVGWHSTDYMAFSQQLCWQTKTIYDLESLDKKILHLKRSFSQNSYITIDIYYSIHPRLQSLSQREKLTNIPICRLPLIGSAGFWQDSTSNPCTFQQNKMLSFWGKWKMTLGLRAPSVYTVYIVSHVNEAKCTFDRPATPSRQGVMNNAILNLKHSGL
jgi:hypothetical protein